MEVVCVARSLLLDAEYSMIFKLLAFVFWVSSYHLNHIHVKIPKQKHSYVNVKLSCTKETNRKQSEEGTYSLRMVMTSVQSQVSRSSVIKSIDLEESQYQAWSYLVEIARVTQWLPVLNGTTNNSLSI
jgi:hypothetical protein